LLQLLLSGVFSLDSLPFSDPLIQLLEVPLPLFSFPLLLQVLFVLLILFKRPVSLLLRLLDLLPDHINWVVVAFFGLSFSGNGLFVLRGLFVHYFLRNVVV
jgi:hypothetical protein